MSHDDDKVVSLEERRRAKAAADKIIQKQQKRLKKGPRKPLPKFNMGYALIGALVVITLLMSFKNSRQAPGDLNLQVVGDTVYGNGSTDSKSFNYALEIFNDNPQIRRLVLQNMPGTKDGQTNIRLAEAIRRRGISTHLEARSVIASGAVDLFIAGENRSLECGAKIGVHSWRTAPGQSPESLGKDQFQLDHEVFLKKMGIDPAFYAFTRDAALPSDIHYMSMDEINQFGLLTEPANCP